MIDKINSKLPLHYLYPQIAALHMQGIPHGFISALGTRFMQLLYRAIAASPYSVVFTYKDESLPSPNVQGFIAGTTNIRKMYQWIFLHYGLQFAVILIPKAFNPSIIKKIFETIIYPLKKRHCTSSASVPGMESKSVLKTQNAPSPQSELLSIAVSPEARGKGVGKELVASFESWLVEKGVADYKVVTDALDTSSNAFYVRCGFVVQEAFLHHGKKMVEYKKQNSILNTASKSKTLGDVLKYSGRIQNLPENPVSFQRHIRDDE